MTRPPPAAFAVAPSPPLATSQAVSCEAGAQAAGAVASTDGEKCWRTQRMSDDMASPERELLKPADGSGMDDSDRQQLVEKDDVEQKKISATELVRAHTCARITSSTRHRCVDGDP